jgi:hypothetical protein
MTWKSKFVRVVLIAGVLGALALSFGANFVEFGNYSWFGF